jgi:hypothetical protein
LFRDEAIKKKYFSGSEKVEGQGAITWAIPNAPSMSFAHVPDSDRQIAQSLGFPLKGDANDYFEIVIPQILFNGIPLNNICFICSSAVEGMTWHFKAEAMILHGEITPNDRILFATVGKQLLSTINASLPSLAIPPVGGLSLGKCATTIQQGYFCLYSGDSINMNGTASGKDAVVMLSNNAVHDLINSYSSSFSPRNKTGSGSENLKISTAKYNYNAGFSYQDNSVAGNTIFLQVNISAGASAGFSTLFGTIGVNYTGSTNPGVVNIPLKLFGNGSQLAAEIVSMPSFSITLTPHGGVGSKIISGLLWPLAEIMGNIIYPILKDMLNGIKFNLLDLGSEQKILGKDFHLSLEDVNICDRQDVLVFDASVGIK